MIELSFYIQTEIYSKRPLKTVFFSNASSYATWKYVLTSQASLSAIILPIVVICNSVSEWPALAQGSP
jgi:pyridoxal/pyridoxine/pyridoxamine kinase